MHLDFLSNDFLLTVVSHNHHHEGRTFAAISVTLPTCRQCYRHPPPMAATDDRLRSADSLSEKKVA